MSNSKYNTVDQLPDLNEKVVHVDPATKKITTYNSVDDLPILKKKVGGGDNGLGQNNGLQDVSTQGDFANAQKPKGSISNDQIQQAQQHISNIQNGSSEQNNATNYGKLIIPTSKIKTSQKVTSNIYQPGNIQDNTIANQPRETDKNIQASNFSAQVQKKRASDLPIAIKNSADLYFKANKIENPTPLQSQQKQKELTDLTNSKNIFGNPNGVLYYEPDGTPLIGRNREGLAAMWQGTKEGFKAATEGNKFAGMSKDEQIAYMKDKINESDEYLKPITDYSVTGSLMNTIGQGVPTMGKAITGATVGAGLTAIAPETGGISLEGLAPTMAFLFSAPDAAKVDYTNSFTKNFADAKKQGLSDDEAYDKAKNVALTSAAASFTSNAFLSRIPAAAMSEKPLVNATKQFFKNGLKSSGEFAGISAGSTALENIAAQSQGLEKDKSLGDITSEIAGSAKDAFIMGNVLHVLSNPSIFLELPKYLQAQYKGYAASANPTELNATLDEMAAKGMATPEGVSAAKQEIKSFTDASQQVPNGLPEDKKIMATGLVEKNNNLEDEKNNKNKAFKEDYNSQIVANEQKIQTIVNSNNPNAHEVDITGERGGNAGGRPTTQEIEAETQTEIPKQETDAATQSEQQSTDESSKKQKDVGETLESQQKEIRQKTSVSKIYKVKNIDGEDVYAQVNIDKNGKRKISIKDSLDEQLWTPVGKTYEGNISDSDLLDANGFSEATIHQPKEDVGEVVQPQQKGELSEGDYMAEKMAKPIAMDMLKIERNFNNLGYNLSIDYDDTPIITDKKTGDVVELEDLPKDFQGMAKQYDTWIGNIDEMVGNPMAYVEKFRKEHEGEETEFEIIPPNQLSAPTEKTIHPKKQEDVGEVVQPQQGEIDKEFENIDAAIEGAKMDENQEFEGKHIDELLEDRKLLKDDPEQYFSKQMGDMQGYLEDKNVKGKDRDQVQQLYDEYSGIYRKMRGIDDDKLNAASNDLFDKDYNDLSQSEKHEALSEADARIDLEQPTEKQTPIVDNKGISEGDKTGLVLYHGSPHSFENFDITKLGSGEGAQAFGHGLYFTNEENIAKGYANRLGSKKNFWQALMDGNKISLSKEDFDFINKDLDALGFDGEKAENENLGEIIVDGKSEHAPQVLDAMAILFGKNAKEELSGYDLSPKEIDRLLEIKKKISDPQLYKVAIHEGKSPSEYDYVNWHDKLSDSQRKKIGIKLPENISGEEAYNAISKKLGGDKKASDYLLSKGIDGIVYKSDKGTGGKTGEGKNYVVFDPKSIRVDEINNQKQQLQSKGISEPTETDKQVETNDYRGQHQLTEFKTTANDLQGGGTGFDWQHVAQDHDLSDKSTKESYRVLKSIKDNPDADITIYRSVPKGVGKINEGDWITLSKNYATEHGMDAKDEGKDAPVISMKVKAKDIKWDGNDLNEFVYKPTTENKVEDKAPEDKGSISKDEKSDTPESTPESKIATTLNVGKDAADKISDIAAKSKDFNTFKNQIKSLLAKSGKEPIQKEASSIDRQEGRSNVEAKQGGERSGETPKEKVLKKRAKPTIKSPLYKQALDVVDESPRTQVLQYFIQGGKIHTDALKELFGNKGGKNIQGELNAKLQLRGADPKLLKATDTPMPKTIKGLAHKLWDNASEEIQNKYSSEDFRNALEDVLLEHNSKTSMANELVKSSEKPLSQTDADYEKYLQQKYGEHGEEVANDAVDVVERMSEDEINQLLKADAANESDALMNDYINQLEEHKNSADNYDTQIENAKQKTKEAQSKLDKAKRELSEAQKGIASQQGTQSNLFGGTQKGMFSVGADEAKNILDPLKQKVKEAQTEFDNADQEWANVVDRSQSELNFAVPETKVPVKEIEYAHPIFKELSEQYDNADGDFRKSKVAEDLAYKLAGDGNKDLRQEIMSAIKGGKVAKAQSGVNALKVEFEKWVNENKNGDTISERKKVSDQIRDIAKKIRGNDPNKLYSDITAVPRYIISKALDIVAASIDAGETIFNAIAKGAKHIRENSKNISEDKAHEIVSNELFETDYFNKKLESLYNDLKPETKNDTPDQNKIHNESELKDNFKAQMKGEGDENFVHSERPPIELSHKGLQETATEFGLSDVEKRQRKTDIQLRKDADDQINAWKEKGTYSNEIDNLLEDAQKGKINDKERVILEQHQANLSDNARKAREKFGINSPEYGKAFKELEKFKNIGQAARSEAGAALRIPTFGSIPDDSIEGYLLQEKELNKGADLTDNQKTTVEKEHEKISDAENEFKKKYEDLQEQYAKLQAEKEHKKTVSSTPKNTKKTHEDFVKERTEIYSSIKDKLKKARQETNVTVVPYAKELIAIAPDVARLAKNLIGDGITKLEDVVKNIHTQLKEDLPDIQEKDVHDILAGVYNEKKKTRSEVAEQMQNLKIQAQLINKYEAMLKGEKPKVEKAKIKFNQALHDLRQKIKGLDKEEKEANKFSKEEIAPEVKALQALKNRNEAELAKINEQLRKGDFSAPEKKKPLSQDDELKRNFPQAYKEALASRHKLIRAREERAYRILKQEYDQRSRFKKAQDQFARILNIPRTLMASMDFSAPLRQAVTATISHPIMAGKAFSESFKQAFSQSRFDIWFHDLKDSPRYDIMQDSKLSLTDPHALHLQAQEEAFMGNLAEKIPVAGKLVAGSERAYVSYLNKMRVDLFNRFADQFEENGKTFSNSPELYKGLASWINNSTGRGELGFFESAAPILNSFLFAPRLIASRFNMLLNPYYYYKLPTPIRIEAMKDMLKFIGAGVAVLTLAKLNGAQVEDDPRSSDFGKIKSGNTRWDIWGGFQPYVRVIAQMATAQRKSASTGKVYDLNGKGLFGKDRTDPLSTFARGKLAPVPSMAYDLIKGKDIAGNKVTVGSETLQHFTPLLFSDVQQAMNDQGIKALFTAGIPSTFGVGVQTYQPKPPKQTSNTTNKRIGTHTQHIQQRQHR